MQKLPRVNTCYQFLKPLICLASCVSSHILLMLLWSNTWYTCEFSPTDAICIKHQAAHIHIIISNMPHAGRPAPFHGVEHSSLMLKDWKLRMLYMQQLNMKYTPNYAFRALKNMWCVLQSLKMTLVKVRGTRFKMNYNWTLWKGETFGLKSKQMDCRHVKITSSYN